MDDKTSIFEERRTHLRTVAYRLLCSVHEADDAVQEAWLRLERSDVSAVDNLPAWLATVVSRREDLGAAPDESVNPVPDPAVEAEQADAVGQALTVVLDTLAPAERLAFCLHDLFAMSFGEIAPMLGRTPAAARQLASRGRRRVRGQGDAVEVDRARQREVVAAFLDASRNGRFDRLLALLHPEAVMASDEVAVAMGSPALLSGAQAVAGMLSGRAKGARLAELDGFAAATWSRGGTLQVVFAFTVEDGLIREIELLASDLENLDVG